MEKPVKPGLKRAAAAAAGKLSGPASKQIKNKFCRECWGAASGQCLGRRHPLLDSDAALDLANGEYAAELARAQAALERLVRAQQRVDAVLAEREARGPVLLAGVASSHGTGWSIEGGVIHVALACPELSLPDKQRLGLVLDDLELEYDRSDELGGEMTACGCLDADLFRGLYPQLPPRGPGHRLRRGTVLVGHDEAHDRFDIVFYFDRVKPKVGLDTRVLGRVVSGLGDLQCAACDGLGCFRRHCFCQGGDRPSTTLSDVDMGPR